MKEKSCRLSALEIFLFKTNRGIQEVNALQQRLLIVIFLYPSSDSAAAFINAQFLWERHCMHRLEVDQIKSYCALSGVRMGGNLVQFGSDSKRTYICTVIQHQIALKVRKIYTSLYVEWSRIILRCYLLMTNTLDKHLRYVRQPIP